MNSSKIRKEFPWPRNLLSVLLRTEIGSVTPQQYTAVEWMLSCCDNASGITPEHVTIVELSYKQHMTNKDIAAKLSIDQNAVSQALSKIETFLRMPFIMSALTDGIPTDRKDLYAYGIPVGTVRYLHNARMDTIDQLLRTTPEELLLARHVGSKQVTALQNALAAHGLSLPKTTPPEYLQPWQWRMRRDLTRLTAYPWELDEHHRKAFDTVFSKFPEKTRTVMIHKYKDGMPRRAIVGALRDEYPNEPETTDNDVYGWMLSVRSEFMRPGIHAMLRHGI